MTHTKDCFVSSMRQSFSVCGWWLVSGITLHNITNMRRAGIAKYGLQQDNRFHLSLSDKTLTWKTNTVFFTKSHEIDLKTIFVNIFFSPLGIIDQLIWQTNFNPVGPGDQVILLSNWTPMGPGKALYVSIIGAFVKPVDSIELENRPKHQNCKQF